ncbi:MAG: hypothetical protein JNM59_04340 [Hyphomonadaceae bacterium]|nr:hypothetical protein [Hyphomonadaceae bacterium]
MSLKDLNTVDIVMRVPGEDAKVALVAYDSGDVTEPSEREALLQHKLAFYSEFVRSGQFERANPALAGHLICIEVVCVLPPTDAMRRIESVVDKEGLGFMGVSVTSDQEFRARLGLKQRTS